MIKKCCREKKSILEIEKIANNLKDVLEPNRLKILCLLKEGPGCVCDIWQCLKLPQNLVSHHLGILKKLNLVFSKRIGRKISYSLNKKVAKKYLQLLNKFLNL